MAQADMDADTDSVGVAPDSTPLSGGSTGSDEVDTSPSAPEVAPSRRPGPSVRPALVVVGVALFLILLFGIGSAVTDNPAPKTPSPAAVKGTGLVAEPSTATLHPIEILGTPPADVLDAVVLPKGAHELSATPWSGSTQYSGKMSFRLDASQAALVRFFRDELHAHGWSIVNVGPAHGQRDATEVLAQRASTDGWFWEAGVIVSPTSFGHGATAANETRFSLDLYEMPDAT